MLMPLTASTSFGSAPACLAYSSGVERISDGLRAAASQVAGYEDWAANAVGPALAGRVNFHEIVDDKIRLTPDLARVLLELTDRRLPYLRNRTTNIVVSGAIASIWRPVLFAAADALGMSINVVALPSGLWRGGKLRIGAGSVDAEILRALEKNPSVYFDDSFSSGRTFETARAVVASAGGRMHGAFVVTDHGSGDEAAIYKSTWSNPSSREIVSFPAPSEWSLADSSSVIGVQSDGALFRVGTCEMTRQGRMLLAQLADSEIPVAFYFGDLQRAREQEMTLTRGYRKLKIRRPLDATVWIGNFGAKFEPGARHEPEYPFAGVPLVQTVGICHDCDRSTLRETDFPAAYFLNRLVENGVLVPEIRNPTRAARTPSGLFIDLRSYLP